MATMDGKHMTKDQVRSTEEAFSTARALDLALEALEYFTDTSVSAMDHAVAEDAITAIKQARAIDKMAENARELGLDYEPVQEPVAWRFQSAVGGWAYGKEPPIGSKYAVQPLYTTPPAAPVQEFVCSTGLCHYKAQRPVAKPHKWVGLSEEEIDKRKHLIDWTATWSHGRFAYEIEQLLKEKNA